MLHQCFQHFDYIFYQVCQQCSSLSHTMETFNPFPNKPLFLHVCSTILMETLSKKEELLIRAISPFPTVFSTQSENFLSFS